MPSLKTLKKCQFSAQLSRKFDSDSDFDIHHRKKLNDRKMDKTCQLSNPSVGSFQEYSRFD